MMRKSTLVLIILISTLMFYVGCDDNDGGGGGEGPPPGGGVPPPEACNNCPCDYFNVPQTSDCWSLGITPNPTFTTQADEQFASCEIALNNPDAMVFASLITQVSQGEETGGTCQISITNPFVMVPKECQDAQVAQTNVSADQIQDCRTCLEEYATALNGSVMLTNEPPYMCAMPPPEGGGVPPGPAGPVPVRQTGQTTCWDSAGKTMVPPKIACAGTGQDGNIRAGVEWPNPRFTDNGDGTIRDNLTELVWLKDANCFGSRTWGQALTDANTLSAGNCGLKDGSKAGDWRLPNVLELLSLGDFENSDPALPPGAPFVNVRFSFFDFYWSSTTVSVSGLTNVAWGGSLESNGFVAVPNDKKMILEGVSVFVLPVRGGSGMAPAPLPRTGQTTCWDSAGIKIDCAGTGQDGDIRAGVLLGPRFFDNMDGTIRDNLTGLIWLRNANCFGRRTWAQALGDANTLEDKECGLNDGSKGGDWRLPNELELLSLVDFENSDPALPAGHGFMNVQFSSLDFYWSSTTAAGAAFGAWGVGFFGDRIFEGFGKRFRASFVLPVRGGS